MPKRTKFRFRKHDTIGSADAEGDKFLEPCFVDTGDMEILCDCNDPRSIVVGRTGTGKTALLRRLLNLEERAIEISPESLSLSYISNSNIIKYLLGLGVNLDVFYDSRFTGSNRGVPLRRRSEVRNARLVRLQKSNRRTAADLVVVTLNLHELGQVGKTVVSH